MVVLSVLKNGSILASPGITALKATGDKLTKSVQAPPLKNKGAGLVTECKE